MNVDAIANRVMKVETGHMIMIIAANHMSRNICNPDLKPLNDDERHARYDRRENCKGNPSALDAAVSPSAEVATLAFASPSSTSSFAGCVQCAVDFRKRPLLPFTMSPGRARRSSAQGRRSGPGSCTTRGGPPAWSKCVCSQCPCCDNRIRRCMVDVNLFARTQSMVL